MQVARKEGLPVPWVLCYGDHRGSLHAPVSILMTCVAGDELGRVYETLGREERGPIAQERTGICSIIGTPIRSIRVPRHLMGPFESEQKPNGYLIAPASAHGFQSRETYEATLARAIKKQTMSHRIGFSHGDLKHHNIMVHGGRITGFIDWESAGWYPDYWEFTTVLRFARQAFWWCHFVMRLGGGRYLEELECDRA
ncbi:kinase-like protein [Aspergillus insuetus]